jgi:nicotinate-nucleotide adenylyltransferase
MCVVGIFGGSFDPVHNAHIKLAEHAYKELGLSKVIFIPAYLQPFKVDKEVTNEVHRINMLELATKEYPYFEVSDIEVKMGGKSYTARTLTELKKEYDELYFILGADSYLSLARWYMPEVIFKQATIACAIRDDVDMDLLKKKSEEYRKEFQGNTAFLKMPRTDISSTDLRGRLSKGEKPLDLISEDVYAYIKENGLYV